MPKVLKAIARGLGLDTKTLGTYMVNSFSIHHQYRKVLICRFCTLFNMFLYSLLHTMKVRVTIRVLFGVFYAVVDIQCSQFKFGLQQNLKGLVVFDLSFLFNVHDTTIMNHHDDVSLMTAYVHMCTILIYS
jgi:hypothetical protein